jgi:hypothetical protein
MVVEQAVFVCQIETTSLPALVSIRAEKSMQPT